MITNVEAAMSGKRTFSAKYSAEPWFGYAELRMTDCGYCIFMYVTSIVSAEKVLPKEWAGMPVEVTTLRF